MHTFFIAPTGFGVGLTSISLGLVGALERTGLKVGFFKPIAQPHQGDMGPERSSELIARTHGLHSPKPLALSYVERMLGDGQLDELLEQILSLYHEAAADKDVVIVEGMVPTRQASYAARINLHLAKSLDAEVILVSAQEQESLAELSERVEVQTQLFGGPKDPKVLGLILNKIRSDDGLDAFVARLKELSPLLKTGDFRLVGCIPWLDELNAPRTRDIAELLGARVLNAGDYEQRRMLKIVLCARAVANSVQLLKPGTLVVTPGDRDDIILSASLAAMNGTPLAGLLLCSDFAPDPRILELCRGALLSGLPVMTVSTGSYDTATNLNRLNNEIPIDDKERADKVADFVASHIDHEWLFDRCAAPRELRMSPSAFRYQLVQRAKAANKRIVLPEGSEPRTVNATPAASPAACCWPGLKMSTQWPRPKASTCRKGWKFSTRI
jgi:phosphate acetyltransferase